MKGDGTGWRPWTKPTAGGGNSLYPAWSPDGSKIAFLATRALDGSDAAGSPNFWVINADGTGASPLTKLTAVTQPAHVGLNEILIRPTEQDL